jgi:Trypsin-like peptidase domain
LLQVDPKASLAPPLRLADDATLAALKAGDPVAYVGFPMENLIQLDLKAPNPVSQTSSIVGLVTFTLVKPVDGSGQLIEHSLPGIGGASGSPIINSKGEVIGLFNSINVVPSIFGDSRIANPVQINFAQRVDVLKQILQEPLAIDMEALRTQWKTGLENYKSRRGATEIIVANALDLWTHKWGANLVPERLRNESVAIDGSFWVGDRPAATLTFEAAPGHYFAVAVSTTYRDIDLAATRYDSGIATSLASDDALEHYPMVSFDIEKAAPVTIFVIDRKFKPGLESASSQADVSIYRIPTDKPNEDSLFEQWLKQLSPQQN